MPQYTLQQNYFIMQKSFCKIVIAICSQCFCKISQEHTKEVCTAVLGRILYRAVLLDRSLQVLCTIVE